MSKIDTENGRLRKELKMKNRKSEYHYYVYLRGDSNAYNCNGLVYSTWAKNRAEAEDIAALAVTLYNNQYLEAKPSSQCRNDLYDVAILTKKIECHCLVCDKSTGKHDWQDRHADAAQYCGCRLRREI